MRAAPTWATSLGDHRFDEELPAYDPAMRARRQAERARLLARLAAIQPAQLNDTDRVSHAMLRGALEATEAEEVCKFHEWSVGASNSSVVNDLSFVVEGNLGATRDDAVHLVKRMAKAPARVDEAAAWLRRGLASGRVASREQARRAIAQLDAELAKPVEQWAMAAPIWAKPPTPDPWPAGERARLVAALRELVAAKIKPRLVAYRAVLHDEVLPRARGDREGLASLPDGDACYRATILNYLGFAETPAALHALGEREIARTDRELTELGARVLGTKDLASTIARLRDDRALYFTSRDELMAAATANLARAKAAVPRFFSRLPKTDCVTAETPAYEAPFSTTAYYRPANYDGSKPGEYFVNTYKPETRARFELEALTWHESIPGHHLQLALAQELGDLPLFRKLEGSTAFVEGWALYTERLADEMGLYTADLDRLGKISFDAWRGARLVVDTGIHALGWTRAQAEAYMRAHTALTEINIVNEVDRYIGWPGQALAYKVGQLEILKLRAEAEAKLGDKFDLKAFHAVVLGAGAVPLPVLAERVHAWLAR